MLREQGAGDSVLIDLGVMRDWAYYSGVVFEAYAAGAAAPVAVGGRYDGLAARFGRDRPAVGFTVILDLLHRAVAAANGEGPGPRLGVVLAGGLEAEAGVARAVRAAGLPVVALPDGDEAGEALAGTEGWRYVARREGEGWSVLDRARGERFACARLEEALPWRA
jgi:ATP phosphoribosyltransferase regulatory subunit